MDLVENARRLAAAVDALSFGPPVVTVYNPLDYAFATHSEYLKRFGPGTGRVLLVGLNPGPFGMTQTGVPFGDVPSVRDWLGISGVVGRPSGEIPERPVSGFACPRREVSGQRVWGWARQRCGTPERFFREFYIQNYCPLVFMAEGGRNITPDKLARSERDALFAVCDAAMATAVTILQPRLVVGFGRVMEQRLTSLLGERLPVVGVTHPSPANPASSNWAARMDAVLAEAGLVPG